jgi:hypothetical protein
MNTCTRFWKRTTFTRRTDKQMKSRKVSSIINSVNQKTSKMKKGEISTYLSIITLDVNDLK